MCMPVAQQDRPFFQKGIFSGASLEGMQSATKLEDINKIRSEGRMKEVFGDNPLLLKKVAQTEGREYSADDPYGNIYAATSKERQALEQRIADFDKRQQTYEQNRAKLGTISTTQSAAVKTPSTATRTPVRVQPIRSSLKTSYGTKQIPTASSLSSGTGLNVPN